MPAGKGSPHLPEAAVQSDSTHLGSEIITQYFVPGLVGTTIVLRPLVCSSTAGPGLNLFITSFVILAFLAWLMKESLSGQITLIKTGGLGGLLLVWGLLIALSPFSSTYRFGSMEYAFIWLGDILLFYLVIQSGRKLSGWLLRAFLATGFIIVLYGFYQYIYGLANLRYQIQQTPSLIADIPQELKAEFIGRINVNEPFGTFLYQNSLAGYLTLILPVLLGILFQVFSRYKVSRSSLRETLGIFILLVFLVLGWFILFTTGSRGGWVASGISLIVFLILVIRHQFPKLVRTIIKTSIIVGIILGIIAFTLVMTDTWVPKVLGSSRSMELRVGYWQGTWEVAKRHPLMGVGLNNISSGYIMHKSAGAEETTHTHNDFLEILAELGILGFLVFIGIWLIIIIRAMRLVSFPVSVGSPPVISTTQDITHKVSLVIILAAFVGFIFAQLFAAPLQISDDTPWLFPFIFFLIWILVFAVGNHIKASDCLPSGVSVNPAAIQKIGAGEGRFLYAGILVGIIGFIVHSIVDFNFYEAGLSQGVWLMAGCLYAEVCQAKCRLRTIKVGKAGGVVIILWSLLIMAVIGMSWIPHLLKSERLLEEGKEKLCPPLPKYEEIMAGVKSLWDAGESVPRLWKGDVRPWLELASFCYRINPGGRSRGLLQDAQEYIDKAILSQPTAPLYFLKGAIWETVVSQSEGNERVQALKESISAFQEAARLYPTRPENFYRLGKVLEMAGENTLARESYENALRLHQKVSLERLKLPPETLQDINQRLSQMRK